MTVPHRHSPGVFPVYHIPQHPFTTTAVNLILPGCRINQSSHPGLLFSLNMCAPGAAFGHLLFDWTYRMVSYPSPPFFSFLTRVEQASPPRLYMGHEPFPSLMCFLLLSLFLWRLASCYHHDPILILTLPPFCPSTFPISSIYPLQSDFPFSFSYQVLYGPCWLSCIY